METTRSQQTTEQQRLYGSLRTIQDKITTEEDKLLIARQGLDRLMNRRESRGKEGRLIRQKRSKLLMEIEEAESSQKEKLIALEEFQRQLAEIQVSRWSKSHSVD